MSVQDNWRQHFNYPPQWFSVEPNLHMHFVDAGTGDSPILAVHGNPTWSFYWRSTIRRFAPTQRVVAMDHIGCGLSDKPQAYNYCLEQHRDNLLALISELDLKDITLLAHDWGGPIGLSALIEQPQRFKRIILLNTGAFPPHFVPKRIAACRIPILGNLGMRGANLFSRAAVTMAVSRQPLSAVAKHGLLAPYDSWRNRIGVARFVQDIPRDSRSSTWKILQNLEAKLPTYSHLPALFVWGMQDWCFNPDCLHRLQKLLPHAESVEIGDAGHYVMEDATEEVLRSIENFLNRTN
jgi:cis-3-alkyl-4-acyloxetan-2-one decarboxylase